MKDIQDLSKDLQKWEKELVNNLIEAQDEVANEIWQEIYQNANSNTGQFKLSIYKTPTELNSDGIIETGFGSNDWVISSSGKMYNLGWLLETGTSPHLIEPVPPNKTLHFVIDGKDVFTKRVNHPGTIAYNNFENAINNNHEEYRQKLKEAINKSIEEIFK